MQTPFKWRHFQPDIILLCVRWYLRYSLSYRDLEEIMLERGLQVDHTTIYRLSFRSMHRSWRSVADRISRPATTRGEWMRTSIKVKKQWVYLYRAVDSEGNTLEFLLSPSRDAEAATCFFEKTLDSTFGSASRTCSAQKQVAVPRTEHASSFTPLSPRVINVDKNAAYPKAIAALKAAGVLPEQVELRQVKYLNNLIEQDHRFIKR